MTKVPFKVKHGIDATMQRIVRVQNPISDYDAANKNYVDNIAVAAVNYVYSSDAISTDVNSPVTKTYTNGIFLTQISTATNEINFFIKFDRNTISWSIPDIEYGWSNDSETEPTVWIPFFTETERFNVDFTQSTINNIGFGETGTLEISSDKKTFTYNYIDDDINPDGNQYLFFKNGQNTFVLDVTALVAPNILSSSITSGYPSGQDELSNGQSVTFSVTSNEDIYGIEVDGIYYTANSENFGSGSTSRTIQTTVTNGPTNTDTALNGYYQIRVKDINGTWSEWYDSGPSGGSNESDFMRINNTAPQFTSTNFSYPFGKTALDTSDTSTITYGLNYLGFGGTVTGIAINSSQLSISKISNTEFIATAIEGIYLFSTSTVRIRATRIRNGRITDYSPQINIASINMTINQPSTTIFRSGPNPGKTTTFSIGANQRIKTRSISLGAGTPSGITLVSQGTISGQIVTGIQIRIDDIATKGNFNLNVNYTGLSNRTTLQSFALTNKGFIQRTISNVSINNPVQLPTSVTDFNNVIVSVGDGVNFNSCSYFDASTTTIEPGFQGDPQDQINEFYVYESGGNWFIIFDNNVLALAQPGGWANDAYIIIEETI